MPTFYAKRPQDKIEDFALRKSIEPRENTGGRDILNTERLCRQEQNSAGDDKQAIVDKNECLVFKREENGLHSKKDTKEREPEKKGESSIASETMMDKCSNIKQSVDKTNGDQFCER